VAVLRLFVALELPDEVRRRIAMLSAGLPDARWVAPENLHVTLRFIGEVDEYVAEDIDSELVGVRGRPIKISLDGLGCFESRDRVRAVWARVVAGEELAHLQRSIEHAVRRAGLEPDTHKFVPHVTLTRLRRVPVDVVAPYLAHNGDFRAGPFDVAHFTLFRSHMGHGGSHYEALAQYDLTA
jgi:2'-5' RNA ligase